MPAIEKWCPNNIAMKTRPPGACIGLLYTLGFSDLAVVEGNFTADDCGIELSQFLSQSTPSHLTS